MDKPTHRSLVSDQFSPRAADYVASAVHAAGADLARMAELVNGQRTARLLDLGCGGGHVSYAVAPHVGQVVALDLSDAMLQAVQGEAARRGLANITTQQGSVERLSFADASFDIVMSRYSAHHWQGFPTALREARRVLKPGGIAAFADAYSPGLPLLDTHLQTIELLRDPSHVRDYAETEWMQALMRAGFAIGAVTRYRVRLDFPAWIARMRTPEIHVAALRSLQGGAPDEVARHFEIGADGSFTLDSLLIEAFADESEERPF